MTQDQQVVFGATLKGHGTDHVHVDVRIFAGPDEDHLASCGQLTMRAEEARELLRRLAPKRS